MDSFNMFNISIAAPQRGPVVGHMFHDSPVAGSMTLVGGVDAAEQPQGGGAAC